jgi:hypothetical protein
VSLTPSNSNDYYDMITPQHFEHSNNNSKWSTLADVIINEIVSYLSTNERLIIWERICRNYHRSSLNGNGWMHNAHLTPLIKLNWQRKDEIGREINHYRDENVIVLGRFRYYHRIRYLTLNYSLDKNDGKDMKWLSLTHLHLIMPPSCPKPSDMIKSTISNMPILTSLTLQVGEGSVSISIPSNSTLTSVTLLTPFSDGIRDLRFVDFAIGVLPKLRTLTIGSGVKIVECMHDAVPCLETLSFGRPTRATVWRSIIKQCGSSLRTLNDHLLSHKDLIHLVDHAPHLTSLSIRRFHDDYEHQCLEPIAQLTNLKHLSIDDGGDTSDRAYGSLRSLVNLRSLNMLNFEFIYSHESLILLVRHLDARNGNGRLITMNDMNVNQWTSKLIDAPSMNG